MGRKPLFVQKKAEPPSQAQRLPFVGQKQSWGHAEGESRAGLTAAGGGTESSLLGVLKLNTAQNAFTSLRIPSKVPVGHYRFTPPLLVLE